MTTLDYCIACDITPIRLNHAQFVAADCEISGSGSPHAEDALALGEARQESEETADRQAELAGPTSMSRSTMP